MQTGQLGSFLGELDTLGSFSVSNCGLTGPIPSDLGNLPGMQQLWLYGNQLSGEIPEELGNLLFMSTLEVEDNNLSGSMPGRICNNFELGFLTKLGADCGTPVEVDVGLSKCSKSGS
jgi:hypothetical protein